MELTPAVKALSLVSDEGRINGSSNLTGTLSLLGNFG
jgi:hypothetical protein